MPVIFRIHLLSISCVATAMLATSAGIAHAQPQADYYSTVDTTDATTLRATLHPVIDDHVRYPYTASSTDTWDMLEAADQDPNNSSAVLDIYKNSTYPKQGGGNTMYNREHVWPKSYGFPDDGSTNYPYTDGHHLHISDISYNSARGSLPFESCGSGCNELTTDAYNGEGGGSGMYPGNSNWYDGSGFEVWGGRRGDVARTMFYMDIRYEGGTHNATGASEPDLILTDNISLINGTSSNQSIAYMGLLSVLLQWHSEDPVDDYERRRNNVIEGYQGNRNPFIDHPEWVHCLYNNVCTGGGDTGGGDTGGGDTGGGDTGGGDTGGGGVGTGVVFINEFHYDNSSNDIGEFIELAGPSQADLLGWQLVAYNGSTGAMYQVADLSGVFPDQGGCMGTLDFSFSGLQNGAPDGIALVDASGAVVEFISYEGTFSANDGPAAGMTSSNIGVSESSSTPVGYSLQRTGTGASPADFTWGGASADTRGAVNGGQTFADTCGTDGGGTGSSAPWINELHYDNSGTDVNEFVEIAGPSGMDLTGWELVGYNGNGGTSYQVITLSGTIPVQASGYGTRSFSFPGLQNGSPDGIALIDAQGSVVQFLSYEGSFTAADGPAAGVGSIDIGVYEDSGTSTGQSLQLTGTGCGAGDFTWAAPATDSPGSVNSGQTLSCQ